ncbi:hypothetical protein ACE6H2_008337 [Prunus campanulata]
MQTRESFLRKWRKIFVASCLFAVVLDPLFLYVPMMKYDIKCLQSDRNLKIAALLLRSLTDLFYLFDIIFQIYTSHNYSGFMHEYRRRQYRSKIRYWRKFFVPTITKTMWGSYNILIDILAILPLPQVAILTFFSKLRDLRFLNTIRMVTMNLFVLLQYVPRVFRIYLSCKELKQRETEETAIWIKGVLNFFMYILASHVLGAIWYFFAIQRMATCWHDACRQENRCNTSTFGCHDHHAFRNITFLNDICSISPVNVGIYITVLQSGIPGSTNFFQKFSNCFWWGLRNLSSLGSNLEPSVDGWENLFAASISIIGLLLFLYLIGNLQTYMQLDTARIEAYRHNMKVKQKMEKKDNETELWLSENGIPKRLQKGLKLKIMEKVQQELEENRDADLDYILSILPLDLQSQITDHKHRHEMKGRETELWLSENGIPKRLHKDMKLKIMEKVQQELEENRDADLDYILPILPLDLQSQITDYKHRHEMKGRETELWLSENGIPKRLHKDTKLKIMEKVQQELEENRDADLDYILSILPLDLQSQITDYKHRHEMKGQETELWLSENGIPKRLHKDMKLKILEKVQQELEENRDADLDYILSILPLDLKSQITYYKHRHKMKGRETELWLSKNCIPKRLHKDMKLKIMEKVRQELEEDRDADLDYILSILPVDLQSQIRSCMPMARLKQVPTLQNMDEPVLRRICQYLEPREFDDNSIIIEKGKPLEMMLFIVDGLVSIEKRDGSSSNNNNLQQRPRGAGEVCGEELLLWPVSISFPLYELLAAESAEAIGHVEALVLTATYLLRVVEMDYLVGMMRRTFSAKELEKATDNYHRSRIIRIEWNFATFYKGVLPMPDDDKTVVVVKYKYSGYLKFAAVASQTNHINVVRFLGVCVEEEKEPALVFEYIPNGTLFEHIHKKAAVGSFEGSSSSPTALLSFELRLKIASETAGALAYLHSLTPPIIHLCLSTKHVLLDDHYTAKLSAIGQSQSAFRISDLLKEGYTDPHFQRDRLAEKSDVYSFGVILAELLTSQKPPSPNSEWEEPPLATYLLSSIKEGRLNQILDGEIIVNEATSETAKKVADLAKRCLRSKRERRPSMQQVAEELEKLRKFMAEYQRGEDRF